MPKLFLFPAALFLAVGGISPQAEASFPNENHRDLVTTITAASREARPQSDEFMPQVASSDHTIYFPAKMERAQAPSRHSGWLIMAGIASILSALALRRLPKAAVRKIQK